MTVKKEGASTQEGIEQEAAEAEAKRTQARVEIESAGSEAKTISQAVVSGAKPSFSAPKKIYNKEEISTKGE